MKKIILLTLLISTLSCSEVITEPPKEIPIIEKVYDLSKVNSKFLKIKEVDRTVYIINKNYITDIKIYTDNSIYVEFISYGYHGGNRTIKVHEDSIETIYRYLTEKGDTNE